MISVNIQLKRHITKLVKKIAPEAYIDHSFTSGVIHYKSNARMNYNDTKCFYKFDSSTNNFDEYKLNMQLDFIGTFASLHGVMYEVKP